MNNIVRAIGLAVLTGVLCLGLPWRVASANDTSLNLSVNPPQLLAEGDIAVRMLAEHITIHFGAERTLVEVEFTFRSTSDYTFDCWAGFPDEDLLYRYIKTQVAAGITEDEIFERFDIDDQLVYGEISGGIENFSAWTRSPGDAETARTPLPYELLRVESLASTMLAEQFPAGEWASDARGSLLLCRAFELHFEPGQDVIVGHSYDAATGGNVESQSLFQYQLVTGRNWQGTIGEAVIDVFLEPDVVGPGLFFGAGDLPDFMPVTSPGKSVLRKVAPGHYRTVWRDFEPEGDKGWIYLATYPPWALEDSGEPADTQQE